MNYLVVANVVFIHGDNWVVYVSNYQRECAKTLKIRFMSLKVDFLYLIMVHNEGNIGKKFQPCIFCRRRENLL